MCYAPSLLSYVHSLINSKFLKLILFCRCRQLCGFFSTTALFAMSVLWQWSAGTRGEMMATYAPFLLLSFSSLISCMSTGFGLHAIWTIHRVNRLSHICIPQTWFSRKLDSIQRQSVTSVFVYSILRPGPMIFRLWIRVVCCAYSALSLKV